MTQYDLCIAWNWQYDADFVALLETACQEHGLSLLQITPLNAAASCAALQSAQLAFSTLLDRASDADPQFLPVSEWARQHGIPNVNPYRKARRAWDKATMHSDFIAAGLPVPQAIILAPFSEQPQIPSLDLSVLGPSFSIKPACRGGGQGVINAASSMDEVREARQQYPHDRYLLQEHVKPVLLGQVEAWFRVIYCLAEVHPCWWDVQTHVYEPLRPAEQTQNALVSLYELASHIAAVCGLGLFSTEMALTEAGDFVIVDYVNDPLDLRLQSKAVDGVPDAIVSAIARRLVRAVVEGP